MIVDLSRPSALSWIKPSKGGAKAAGIASVTTVMRDLVLFAFPEAMGPAGTSRLPPFFRIKMAVSSERRCEFIATRVATLGKLGIACEFKPDLMQ